MIDHERRRQTLGASESSIVLGVLPWRSPFELWCIKRGLISPERDDHDGRMEAGHRAEQMCAGWYAEERFGDTSAITHWPQHEPATHEEHRWLSATPDYLHDRPTDDGDHGWLLEVKTASEFSADKWDNGPPLVYQVQAQHQMLVTGTAMCTIAVMIGFTRPRWWDIPADPEFHKLLISECRKFWNYVESGIPPATDGSEATIWALGRLHPDDTGEVVRLDSVGLRSRRDEIATTMRQLEKEKSEIDASIMAELRAASYGTFSDGTAVSWKTSERQAYAVPARAIRSLRYLKKLPKGAGNGQ